MISKVPDTIVIKGLQFGCPPSMCYLNCVRDWVSLWNALQATTR